MTSIRKFTFNPFSENTYVLYDESRKAIVIDPGCHNRQEESELKNFISSNSLEPVFLLNTHCHVDHVLGNRFIFDEYGLSPAIHKEDLVILRSAVMSGQSFGVRCEPSPEPSLLLEEGQLIEFGSTSLQVLHVPGHSPGHVVFLSEKEGFIIGGDVLFYGSIGRTDLPLGDHDTLIRSIHSKLMVLDEDYVVHPGHGPRTTIGFEKKNNPFLSA